MNSMIFEWNLKRKNFVSYICKANYIGINKNEKYWCGNDDLLHDVSLVKSRGGGKKLALCCCKYVTVLLHLGDQKHQTN